FSRRASMSEDEKKAFDKEQKEMENRYNKQIAEQFRSMITELANILEKPVLKDTLSNKTLGQDKDDKVILEQAQTFRLDHLDIRSPERKKQCSEMYDRHKERLDFLFDDKERRLNSLKR